MANEPTPDPRQPAPSVAYDLALSRNPNAPSKLASPLLDQDMHPGRAVDVVFESGATTNDAPTAFEVDSLIHYLTHQANVRRALEAALDRHHDEWTMYRELPRGPAVWNVVRIDVVAFQERKLLTREDAFRAKEIFPNLTDEFIEASLADADTPATRWKFMIMFAGLWDDGHQRIAYFRDGALSHLAVDG